MGGALLRTACTADVMDVFDKLDVQKRGSLCKEGISSAAAALGFPIDDSQLSKAMSEMGADASGEVNFPKFLMWWNTCDVSSELHKEITMGTRFEQGLHGGVSTRPAKAEAKAE